MRGGERVGCKLTIMKKYSLAIAFLTGAVLTQALPIFASYEGPALQQIMAEISANLYGGSSTMAASYAGTTSGLLSKVDYNTLMGLTTAVRTAATSTRSLVTSTGASGFQVSSTKGTEAQYNVTIGVTATIGAGAQGTIALEIAATNSATASDWSEIGRCTNGQTITLAVVLQSVQTIGCQVSGYVPPGYYAKLRSITTSGTPTFAYNSGQEVIDK